MLSLIDTNIKESISNKKIQTHVKVHINIKATVENIEGHALKNS